MIGIPSPGRSVAGVGNTPAGPTGGSGNLDEVVIPEAADFTDQGVVLTPDAGEWDARFPAGAPGTIVKKAGTYFLYYVGADGNRVGDDGPSNRCIGLATSTDGITWAKHASNPVISHAVLAANDLEEEGSWRIAAMLDTDGTILLYVGRQFDAPVLSGYQIDIHLFTSTDGVSFTDQGLIIAAPPGGATGSEDELGPLGAATDGTNYYLQYIAQVPDADWGFAASTAQAHDDFAYDDNVLTEPADQCRYGSNPIRISETEWISFVGTHTTKAILVYRTSAPDVLGTLADTWSGLGEGNFAVFLDRDTNTWIVIAADDNTSVGAGGQGLDNWNELRLYTAPVEYV